MRISLKKKKSRFTSLQSDFYKIEKDDIEDPAWENVKKLVTNKEIKKQVRTFWNSNVISDPNRNLTFHSYKEKRKATSPSSAPPSKRRRICTIDNEIQLLEEEKEIEADACVKEMKKEMNLLSENYNKERLKLNLMGKTYKSQRDKYGGKKMQKLYKKHKKRTSLIINKFQELVNKIDTYFLAKICKVRAEQSENCDENEGFVKTENEGFVKTEKEGLVKTENEGLDHAMTTDSEFQELAKINNIYELFDMYYR